ncbi:disease resistance protein At4g27190-like [Durio zibethinus]|uniref:Disease resistance protein At4g27190-like n=1 Tax=Durio zibethinus TaxID=66656 RepID=A0A6P5WVR5_DURZI|nr:disease resistance protein At4g27190-like [Durio zibethinus]
MEAIAIGAAANLSSDAAKGIFQEIKRHMRNVEKIKPDVELWCSKVDKVIKAEVKSVRDLQDKAKSKCFIGLCPNLKSRYRLSRKAEEVVATVNELLQQGEFNCVSCPAPPADIVDATPKDFEAFESRAKVFRDIIEALKDGTTNVIGVYGTAGVGKTTPVREICRQAKEDKLFDSVIMAVVNQTPDLQKIQDQLADLLGLKLEEKSVEARAGRLRERLKKEKKVLVILDDIWKKLDLNDVGIPFGDENKGCSILLTSRDLNVLRNEMDARKNFAVSVLEDKEAWDLFKKMAGDDAESPELRSTAVEVAKKCAGLPVAIATVARALRNKGLFAWNDALRKLQRPSPTNFKGVPANVYSAIELSYNHLERQELKQTFLLCGLLGHNTFIRDLLRYTIGLGLFHGVNRVEESRDRLLTVVSELKSSCLLRDSYTNVRVDMHDLICDVALAIPYRDYNVFALKDEDDLEDWPNGLTMEKCTMISLRYANISYFPKELKCPQLDLFLLYNEDLSVELPINFFKETLNLKVLDLTDMQFQSLSSSISFLTNLRTLCLDQCILGDIAGVGELKNLEILSLLRSDLERLPKEIGELIKLRLLDLSGCTRLKIIPPGVLSSLSRLEELYMGDSFVQWEVERRANQQSNASLAELKLLSHLTTLDVLIPDAKIMPADLFSKKLER